MDNTNPLYKEDYFTNRFLNDKKRLKSFLLEKKFLKKNHIDFKGEIFDVGCSTGEFLTAISWIGKKNGSEISEFAINEASKNGISFKKKLEEYNEELDVVVFRGTIQHLPDPFKQINDAHKALKKNGHLVFLATPNSDSIVYKINKTLPVLVPNLNFYIPSETTLINACKNIGFKFLDIEKPYIYSPYKNIIYDHLKFLINLFTRKKPTYSFWGNMMNLILIKE